MAKFEFSDIEYAFDFVNAARQYQNTVVICRNSGKCLFESDSMDIDDFGDESDEEIDYDSDECISVPHKNELDLGQRLIFDFVMEHLPDDYERVRGFFHRRGAYGRYRDLLERREKLQEWYDFESSCTERTLREWCRESNIELND